MSMPVPGRSAPFPQSEHGAYARLAAWQTVIGLIGADSASDFNTVSQQAQTSHWYSIDTTSPWFDNTAWDISIACITSNQLAILSATDED